MGSVLIFRGTVGESAETSEWRLLLFHMHFTHEKVRNGLVEAHSIIRASFHGLFVPTKANLDVLDSHGTEPNLLLNLVKGTASFGEHRSFY